LRVPILKNFIHRKYTVDIDRIQICTKDKNRTIVGFVAAAVSMPMGGCRARRSLVVVVDVVSTATELAVL